MHFAALALVSDSAAEPSKYWGVNVAEVLTLLDAIRCVSIASHGGRCNGGAGDWSPGFASQKGTPAWGSRLSRRPLSERSDFKTIMDDAWTGHQERFGAHAHPLSLSATVAGHSAKFPT